MPKLSSKGSGSILVIMVLFLGLVVGLYLVERPQIFRSKASLEITSVKNAFLAQSKPVDEDGNQIVFQSARYLIGYQSSTDLFTMVINDTPPEVVRAEVERDLLQKAGDDLAALCSIHFSILVPHSLTKDGLDGQDDKLAICKQYQIEIESSPREDHRSILERIKAIIASFLQNQQPFISDAPIVISQDFPIGAYISLCLNNNTNAEGVWQVGVSHRAADLITNQAVPRCSDPVPDYLVFTEPVPVGAYLSLCWSSKQSPTPQEWVWQVNESGRVADRLDSQEGCTAVPVTSKNKGQSFSRLLSVESSPVSSCPVAKSWITYPSYNADPKRGHCSAGSREYPCQASCPTTGKRARSIDVNTLGGRGVYLPMVQSKETSWKFIDALCAGSGTYPNCVSANGGTGGLYTFEGIIDGSADKWYLQLTHMLIPAKVSLKSSYPSGTLVGNTDIGIVHMTIGKNIQNPFSSGNASTDCDPGWMDTDFMCSQ